MSKEKRIKTLHYLGIFALTIISLYYINQLFSTQIHTLKIAINAILVPFGIALFLSYLFKPLLNLLEKRFKIPYKWLSVGITLVIVTLVLIVFGWFIGSIIYEEATRFFENDWDNIVNFINDNINQDTTLSDIYNQLGNFISLETAEPVIINFISVFRNIIGIIVVIVLIPVFLFFLLHDSKTIFKGITNVFPKKYQSHLKELGKRTDVVITNYFNGRFISMFIMSIMFSIMFIIFGFSIQKSIFFGFLVGFLDIIPYIGGFIAISLPILNSFTVSEQLLFGNYAFIAIIIGNFVLQGFQGNILQPFIMGKEVKIHPLLVLSSFIFFGSLFGISGVILAIPIVGTIKTSVEYFTELKA
ncbi:MAG: AI-2E family transporter [Candidatus Izimaplasma sp.]|nr:AI-2E family transporter [Candidatus Izimaplasma bacterium]